MSMEEQIKPIYEALMGCLSPVPTSGSLTESLIWEKYQNYVDKISEIAKEDYSDYKKLNILPPIQGFSSERVSVLEYRTQLNSLIMALHGKYFSKDPMPFSGQPGMIVSQSQSQSQEVNIAIITQVQDLIDKRLYGSELEEKEKSFLGKIKSLLPGIKSAVELLNLIITTAKAFGLDINQVSKAFGW